MEGVELTASAQSAQGSPQSFQQLQVLHQQPETTGSTSATTLSENFPKFKLSKNLKFTN